MWKVRGTLADYISSFSTNFLQLALCQCTVHCVILLPCSNQCIYSMFPTVFHQLHILYSHYAPPTSRLFYVPPTISSSTISAELLGRHPSASPVTPGKDSTPSVLLCSKIASASGRYIRTGLSCL